jgi:hypothetical protein
VTSLTENEERLVETLRALPPEAAEKVLVWASQLRDLANGQSADWSDSWTDDDLADAVKSSVDNFDEGETNQS